MKAFEKFQLEAGTSIRKFLKHGPTRWLSLINRVNRLIDLWDSLQAFFAAEEVGEKKDSNDRAVRAHIFLQSSSSKLYALFLSYTLPIFTEANTFLQKEDPVLHLMQNKLCDVITDLLVRFVKPLAISKAENLYLIEHSRRSKQEDREDLMIGERTRAFLEAGKADGSLGNTAQTHFYEGENL